MVASCQNLFVFRFDHVLESGVTVYKYTLMERAYPISDLWYIYPDLNRLYDIISKYYDTIVFLHGKILVGDNKNCNLVFNETVKHTDFDQNIVPYRTGVPINFDMIRSLLTWTSFPGNGNEFDAVKTEIRHYVRNFTTPENKVEFMGEIKKYIYQLALLRCQKENELPACQKQFSYFKPKNLTTTFAHSALSTFVMSVLIQSMRRTMQKFNVSPKVIQFAIPLVLSTIIYLNSDSLALSLLSLTSNLFASSALYPRQFNLLLILTMPCIKMLLLLSEQAEPIDVVKEVGVSVLGSVSGNIASQIGFKFFDDQMKSNTNDKRVRPVGITQKEFIMAARQGSSVTILKTLIENKEFDVNASAVLTSSDGTEIIETTAYEEAAANGDTNLCERLLMLGAKINTSTTKSQSTDLYVASMK